MSSSPVNCCLFCFKKVSPVYKTVRKSSRILGKKIKVKDQSVTTTAAAPVNIPSSANDNEDLVSQNARVIFILRNLMELPTHKLSHFLVSYGNPVDWIRLCGKCSTEVESLERTFKEIRALLDSFWKGKSSLIGNTSFGDGLRGADDDSKMEVMRDCWEFAGRHIYNPPTDPFSVQQGPPDPVEKPSLPPEPPSASPALNSESTLDPATSEFEAVKDETPSEPDTDFTPASPAPSFTSPVSPPTPDTEVLVTATSENPIPNHVPQPLVSPKPEPAHHQPTASTPPAQSKSQEGTFSSKENSQKSLQPPAASSLVTKKCPHCQRQFVCIPNEKGLRYVNRLLKNHLAFTHNVGDFKCSKCEMVFPTYAHQRLHKASSCAKRLEEKARAPSGGRRRFHCSTCEKSYDRKSLLAKHELKTHSSASSCTKRLEEKARAPSGGSRRFQCSTCERSFDRKSLLVQHELKIHSSDRVKVKESCRICNRVFLHDSQKMMKASLLHHLRKTHTVDILPGTTTDDQESSKSKPFSCLTCGKSYTASFALQRHEQRAHPADFEKLPVITLQCEVCQREFHGQFRDVVSQNLRKHLRAMHKHHDAAKPKPRKVKQPKVLKDRRDPDRYKPCPKCGRVVYDVNLAKHIRACGRPYDADALPKTKIVVKRCVCHVCGKNLRAAGLPVHLEVKHGIQRRVSPVTLTCSECPETFKSKCLLKAHLYSVHNVNEANGSNTTSRRRLTCDICGVKDVPGLTALREHKFKVHNIGLDCPQEGCKEKLRNGHRLRLHLKEVHGASMPYNCQCVTCGRSFNQLIALQRHEEAKHGENTINSRKPYPCDRCHSAFNTKKSRRKHGRTMHNIWIKPPPEKKTETKDKDALPKE